MMTGKPRRILVFEAGGIGDAILATPALTALRRRFPEAAITALATPRAAPVIESLRLDIGIEQIRLGRRVARLCDAARLVLSARLRRPDLLIDLSSIETEAAARRRRTLVALVGARRSVGRNTDGRGEFFDEAMAESLSDGEHEVRRKLRTLAPLDISEDKPEPGFGVSAADRAAARRRLEESGAGDDVEWIAVNPGSFLPTRRWPADRFARLVAELTGEDTGRMALLTGGESERAIVEQVAAGASGRVLRAVGLPLTELAALVERCRLAVTNDTAMSHLAASCDVPVVVIFGRTNRARYRPWLPDDRFEALQAPPDACERFRADIGPPECRRTDCSPSACMTAIAYDAVLDAARRLLARMEGGDPR